MEMKTGAKQLWKLTDDLTRNQPVRTDFFLESSSPQTLSGLIRPDPGIKINSLQALRPFRVPGSGLQVQHKITKRTHFKKYTTNLSSASYAKTRHFTVPKTNPFNPNPHPPAAKLWTLDLLCSLQILYVARRTSQLSVSLSAMKWGRGPGRGGA